MNPFIDGFLDEIEKQAGVAKAVAKGAGSVGKLIAKNPLKALALGLIGHAGYSGAKAAGKKGRAILARPGQPSPLYYYNARRALGIPIRQTKLQRRRASRHFARYRERK